jgi:hypothetical protein
MDIDKRGFRVALVADELVNPPPGGFDVLDVLTQAEWGAIQLPPAWYPPEVAGQLLEQVAEHAEEFARHGYDLVLVGDRTGLSEALSKVGVPEPDSAAPATADELREFLRGRTRASASVTPTVPNQ